MTTFLYDTIASAKKLLELMKLSLTSSDFYKKVYTRFSGTGLKYLFTLSFIGTFIAVVIILIKLSPVISYFEDRVVRNPVTANIDAVLNKLEPIYYDGRSISDSNQETILLNGIAGETILAIDPNDKLPGSLKKDIPFIFGKTKLFYNIFQKKDSYDYSDIFGNAKKVIDSAELVNLINGYVKYFYHTYIFLLFPMMVILNFAALLLEKLLMVALVYLAIKLYAPTSTPIKSAIRTVAFASGVPALLLPLNFVFLAHLCEMLAAFLIIKALSFDRNKLIRN